MAAPWSHHHHSGSLINRLPEGASVRWYSERNPNGIHANRVGVYWIAQPTGGQFELLVSENGRAPTRLALLDGLSAAAEGRSYKTAVPLGNYHLEVRSLAGTNYVLDPELVNTQRNGLHVAWLDYGGLPLQQVSAIPRAIRDPILRSLAPDLLIWHFKESTTNGLISPLQEQEQWFREAVPKMDVLYIGTPFSEEGTGGTLTAAENQLIRSFAISQNRAFVDCMTPGVSYEWLRDNGYMDDPVHHNFQGGVFLGDAAWNDLGFYALGTNRRLSLRKRGSVLSLEATLSAGLAYQFESSPELQSWDEIAVRTNVPGPIQIELNSTSSSFYRLRIRPAE